MRSETLTVRIDSQTKEALDAIASVNDRDRSYIVKEALRVYLELHHWQVEHIRQGLREAESGKFAPDAQVKKVIAKLTRK